MAKSTDQDPYGTGKGRTIPSTARPDATRAYATGYGTRFPGATGRPGQGSGGDPGWSTGGWFDDDRQPVLAVSGDDPQRAAATAIAVVSFLLGVLSSYARTGLGALLSPLDSSVTGWTVVSVALIWSVRARPAAAAGLGIGSYLLLTVGYALTSIVRGEGYDPTLFGVVGIVLGPVTGLAACWLRERDERGGLATAVLSGLAVGDALAGFTGETGSGAPLYQLISLALGLGLLTWMVRRRLHGSTPITLALGCTAVVAAGLMLADQAIAGMS